MPSIPVSRFYEAIYILDPDLGDEQVTTTSTRYKQVVETAGGAVEKIDIWERRRLAYPVKGRTEGIYVVMQFRGMPNVEAELRRIFLISEDQIRYMIVKPEELETVLPVIEQPVVMENAVTAAPAVDAEALAETAVPSVETVAAPAEEALAAPDVTIAAVQPVEETVTAAK